MTAQALDWPALLRVGLRQLGLKPDEFWRLTPAELLLMSVDVQAHAPMARARLDELARLYPDTQDTTKDTTHDGHR